MSDATSALLRSLNFMNFAGFHVEEIKSRSWASATFTGVRHQIGFRLEGLGADEAADTFLAALEEREFNLPGHILADIAPISTLRRESSEDPVVRIGVEALTIEDC